MPIYLSTAFSCWNLSCFRLSFCLLAGWLVILASSFGQGNMVLLQVSLDKSRVLRHSTKFDNIGDLNRGRLVGLNTLFRPKSSVYPQKNSILTGLNITYFDTGNRILGNGIGAQGSLQGPIFHTPRLTTQFAFGMGGILMGKHYDRNRNPSNLVIGSTLNGLFSTSLNFDYRLFKRLSVIGRGGLTHISNGAFRLPNIGVNAYQFGTGLKYSLVENLHLQYGFPVLASVDNMDAQRSKWFNSATIGFGYFQKKDFEGKSFTNIKVGLFQHLEVAPNFALSAGLHIGYTNFLTSLQEKYPEQVTGLPWRVGLEGSMDWFFNHIYLKGGVGYFMCQPDFEIFKNRFYYKLAGHYCFKNTRTGIDRSPFLGIGLVAYKDVAQYPELIGGYLF